MQSDSLRSRRVKAMVKRFPIHKKQHLYQSYNLYQMLCQGVEKAAPLDYPCVREGCTTTCYFQGTNQQQAGLLCANCGNQNDRIYLDTGLRALISQQQAYIRDHEPLGVLIRLETTSFLFTHSTMTNNLINQLSDFIGDRIISETGIQDLSVLSSQLLDFWKINSFIESGYSGKETSPKQNMYSFCKYTPHKEQDHCNSILLFLEGETQPLKVYILNHQHQPICTKNTFLNDTVITFMAWINTFVFCLPAKLGTRFYFSSLDLHLLREEGILMAIENREWRQSVGRFGCSLVADQNKKELHVIGGYDDSCSQLPFPIISFINNRWKQHEQKVSFQAERSSKGKKEESSNYRFALKSNSYVLTNNIDQEYGGTFIRTFLMIGDHIKDFSIIGSGTDISRGYQVKLIKWNIRQKIVKIRDIQQSFDFSLTKSHLVDVPVRKNLKKPFYGLNGSSNHSSNQKQEHKNTILLNSNRLFGIKMSKSQWMNINIFQKDILAVLLFDPYQQIYTLKTTWHLLQPRRINNNQYIHWIDCNFDLEKQKCQMFPGILTKIIKQVNVLHNL